MPAGRGCIPLNSVPADRRSPSSRPIWSATRCSRRTAVGCEIARHHDDRRPRQDRALAEIGGKALWTKELDRALLGGEIDIAVHSMKDVETIRPETIAIAAMLQRADVRDRLVGADSLAAIREGAVVGTARRAAARRCCARGPICRWCCSAATSIRGWPSWRRARPMRRCSRRGARCGSGTTMSASAIPLDMMLPAPAQGAVGIECRADDAMTRGLLGAIDHADYQRACGANARLLAALEATCHSPVAALATIDGNGVTLRGELFSEDGSEHVAANRQRHDRRSDPGARLARGLLDRAPPSVRARFGG